MQPRTQNRRGNTLIEFTLVGIPVMFVLISTFEMARGMWIYHTLAYAIKEGTRFAIVHGQNCTTAPNTCGKAIQDVATVVKNAGAGLNASQLSLTFSSASNAAVTCTLNNCLSNATAWPQYPDNQPGLLIGINGIYPFQSAIAMFWPGAGSGITFGVAYFPAGSREIV